MFCICSKRLEINNSKTISNLTNDYIVVDNSTEAEKFISSSESHLKGFDTVDGSERVKRDAIAKKENKHVTYGLNKDFIHMDIEMATPDGKNIHLIKKIVAVNILFRYGRKYTNIHETK